MKAKIENGEIVITIAIDALVSVVESGPIAEEFIGVRCVDPERLARWVIARIADEQDDEAPRLGVLIEEQIGEALNYGEMPEDMGIELANDEGEEDDA